MVVVVVVVALVVVVMVVVVVVVLAADAAVAAVVVVIYWVHRQALAAFVFQGFAAAPSFQGMGRLWYRVLPPRSFQVHSVAL